MVEWERWVVSEKVPGQVFVSVLFPEGSLLCGESGAESWTRQVACPENIIKHAAVPVVLSHWLLARMGELLDGLGLGRTRRSDAALSRSCLLLGLCVHRHLYVIVLYLSLWGE